MKIKLKQLTPGNKLYGFNQVGKETNSKQQNHESSEQLDEDEITTRLRAHPQII